LLTKAAPSLRRVAVLWNPDNVATIIERDHLQDAARVLGLELKFYPRVRLRSRPAWPH